MVRRPRSPKRWQQHAAGRTQPPSRLRVDGVSPILGPTPWADRLCLTPCQMVELDIGYVGEVTKVDPTILNVLVEDEYIPVVATIATDYSGQALNINADTAAGEVGMRQQRRGAPGRGGRSLKGFSC